MSIFNPAKNYLIEGETAKGFEKVEDVFRRNFAGGYETGAAFCVYHKGKKVVDLWGGFRDKEKTKPWENDTMCIVFSTTKGISSLAFSLLHSRKLLDYDEKVATYWPEFAHNGKQKITVRQLLAHQAGLLTTDIPLTLSVFNDPDLLSRILAEQKPFWEPGTKQGYHAWTIALYQNEILRRVDPGKRSLSRFFHEEIAVPLGLDIYIGLPKGFNKSRIADMIPFNAYDVFLSPQSGLSVELVKDALNYKNGFFFARSLLNLPFALNVRNFNKDEFRELQMGSGCGFTSAYDLAKLYNEFALGGKTLKIRKETLQELENFPVHPTISQKDIAIHKEIPFSLGFAKPCKDMPFGLNHRAYGSFGAGGSTAFADPEAKLAMGYVMNKMGTHVCNDPREYALRKAVYECIE